MTDLLKDAISALGEAAENEQSIRFGHEVAGVLYGVLITAQAAQEEPTEPEHHEHAWQVLGYHRPESETLVVQVCSCASARQIVAAVES